MEGPHWLCSVSKDLNGSVINLGECLELNVVAPYSVLSLLRDILFKVVLASDDELDEEFALALDVVHASLSDEEMMTLISLVDLVRNCSE